MNERIKQPKALHLAAYWSMKDDQGQYVYSSLQFRDETAAELRRLYEMNKKLMDAFEEIRVNSPDQTDRSFARHVLTKVAEL